jgi:CheY-like chemotaxis protein
MDADHHILLVEDDADTRDSMSVLLRLEGYHVVGAANGQEALEHLRDDCKPCLILLDLAMPVLDGWGFRAQQQQDPSCASIPVVVVSADGSVSQKAGTLGAVDYLKKPVDIDSLLDILKRHC